MTAPASTSGPRRFIIIGLPRSGTTYLMTLLNAHRDVLCAGEQFNPYAVIGADSESRVFLDLMKRDKNPRVHSQAFFKKHSAGPYKSVGYKLMIGHNIRVLKYLHAMENTSIIYVHRNNKLAQVASLIKADTTRRWAQAHEDNHVNKKIDVGPLKISQYWHELATFDYLFAQWFRSLPQKKLKLEYRKMFVEGFEKKLCKFLEIDCDPEMKSPLVKQGANNILDRFQKPEPIRNYFMQLGRKDWLGPEIE
jgi:LPS sulfotransferase NodH